MRFETRWRMYDAGFRRYIVWAEHTCYTCRPATFRAREMQMHDVYRPVSPCATLPRTVWARDRKHALKIARGIWKRFR